ncbi:uncharacterized protein B0T23DRAFT_318104, partial [Neurospora hispaniola]
YNPLITLGWITNMDIQLYTNINTIFNYIAKYISEAEKRIKFYNEITIKIIPQITARNPIKQFTIKFINKFIIKRDWST